MVPEFQLFMFAPGSTLSSPTARKCESSMVSSTPGIYIDRVVVGPAFQKPIESRFIKEYAQR